MVERKLLMRDFKKSAHAIAFSDCLMFLSWTRRYNPAMTKRQITARRGERVTMVSAKGERLTVYRNSKSGAFTTPRSAQRIRDTSSRAAESLRRLAKR